MALKETFNGVRRGNYDRLKILGKITDFAGLLQRAQQEVFVFGIKPRQGSNDVARVCAHAEVGDPANIDRNLHY